MEKQDEFFNDLCRTYSNELYFYVSSIFTDKNIIEEIMQEIFYEAYTNILDLMKLNNTQIRAKLYICAANHIKKKTPK